MDASPDIGCKVSSRFLIFGNWTTMPGNDSHVLPIARYLDNYGNPIVR